MPREEKKKRRGPKNTPKGPHLEENPAKESEKGSHPTPPTPCTPSPFPRNEEKESLEIVLEAK